MRSHWRRFAPQRLTTLVRRQSQYSELFQRAHVIVDGLTYQLSWRRRDMRMLDEIINQHKSQLAAGDSADLLALLIIQAPRAAAAQQQMDKHPHGSRDKMTRLYELIDFNDAYVEAVLSLPESELANFNDQAKRSMDKFCKRLRTRCFSNEQWEAITHGLSREIAVYRGAIKEGFRVRMTSRSEDAKGVDMVISDPESGRSINADIKTRSSYHFRLKDLAREGRISDEEWERAEEVGYCRIVNGHGDEAVEVVLLRIDHGVLGNIVDFSFENSQLLGQALKTILRSADRVHEPPAIIGVR